jgi:poly(3-hydroxybutyrate) depolymerase
MNLNPQAKGPAMTVRTSLKIFALGFLFAGFAPAAGMAAKAPKPSSPAVDYACPDGYRVKEGLNTDFPHKGEMRAFVVVPPVGAAGPAPVWVPLTGTVESTNANLNVPRSGANALMAQKGFMVIGPVRNCSAQDPNDRSQACNGPGKDGWNWMPWREGRAGGPAGEKWKNDAGPDVSFLEAAVKCVGTRWPLDARRFYVGGISSGGTLTNRVLTFDTGFWAGGLPISGEWYVSRDDGTALSFDAARQVVIERPAKIHQGRVGPFPLKKRLSPMIVITVWGGEKDMWKCGQTLCSDYRPTTQAGSNYFSSMKNVVHVACTASHGHMWPQVNTQAFNAWALGTLASHPKGSNPKAFKLTAPPEGYSCKLGPFTDHYPMSAGL